MKRRIVASQIKEDPSQVWREISPASQMAVEYVDMYRPGFSWYEAVRKAIRHVSEGNSEPEYAGEDFYMDEPSEDEVIRFLKARYNLDDSVFSSTEVPGQVRTFQNRRNENKFIETKKYADGHQVARQYMKWDTPEGTVKNYNGAKDWKNGRWHRTTQNTRDMMLEDYDEVTSSEYVASDFSDDRVAFDDSCNFTEAQFKFYYDAFNAFGDWLDSNPIVDIWGIDIDNRFFYVTIDTVGGYTYDSWDEYLKNVPTSSVDAATNYLIRRAKSILMEDEPDVYPEDGEDYDY